MTVDKRRTDACLEACEGISTQNLEDNVPFLELARLYNAVLRERDALREQQEINLSDPAVQKRLAAQWGYVAAGAQSAPIEKSITTKALSKMFLSLDGYDKTRPGYEWSKGWNDAIRQAMNYAQPAPSVPENKK